MPEGKEARPCPDCRWSTYVLSGRPILVVRCRVCHLWFHMNIQVVDRTLLVAGMAYTFDATFNHRYTREDLNTILRCDCLAKQVYCSYGAVCDKCGVARSPVHRIRVTETQTLHEFILGLNKLTYRKSRLPAYTLQHRCGAVPEYLKIYEKAMRPNVEQRLRINTYRHKRANIRKALDAPKSDSSTAEK
jgi:hypothetical protein